MVLNVVVCWLLLYSWMVWLCWMFFMVWFGFCNLCVLVWVFCWLCFMYSVLVCCSCCCWLIVVVCWWSWRRLLVWSLVVVWCWSGCVVVWVLWGGKWVCWGLLWLILLCWVGGFICFIWFVGYGCWGGVDVVSVVDWLWLDLWFFVVNYC